MVNQAQKVFPLLGKYSVFRYACGYVFISFSWRCFGIFELLLIDGMHLDPIISSYGKELKELKTLLVLRTFQNILIKSSIMGHFKYSTFQLEADALTKFRALYPHENYNLDDKSFNIEKIITKNERS